LEEPVVAAGDLLLVGGIRQEIAGELLGDEFVEGLVLVEGPDDVIAIHPDVAGVVAVVAAAVGVAGPDGTLIAMGITAYSATDIARIRGLKSDALEAVLGWRGRPAVIHRDDLVLEAGG